VARKRSLPAFEAARRTRRELASTARKRSLPAFEAARRTRRELAASHLQREPYAETRAAVAHIVDTDVAAVFFDDLFDDRQT